MYGRAQSDLRWKQLAIGIMFVMCGVCLTLLVSGAVSYVNAPIEAFFKEKLPQSTDVTQINDGTITYWTDFPITPGVEILRIGRPEVFVGEIPAPCMSYDSKYFFVLEDGKPVQTVCIINSHVRLLTPCSDSPTAYCSVGRQVAIWEVGDIVVVKEQTRTYQHLRLDSGGGTYGVLELWKS